MRKILVLLAFLFPLSALAQIDAVNGYCNLGASQAATSGSLSTNYLQGAIPVCTVTVYLTGTTNLATIYSDSSSTPLTNPFTAGLSGQWLFYSLDAVGVDIVLSGGNYPNFYPAPVTITDVIPGGKGSSQGFPITIGSTSIAANSTTTSINGLQVNGVTLTNVGSSSTFLNGAGSYTSAGGGLIGTPTFALATDPLGNINPTGVISSYNGVRLFGDSNTACYQFASPDANHCATYAVILAETGSASGGTNSGYGGMSILDATWFMEMYANINPTVTGNPIDHLSVGTNTVRFVTPNTQPTAEWITAANQEMYELAIHETTVPQEKYLPNDPVYATSTGSWTPTFNFVAVAGPIIAGCGYTPGDVLNITGTGFNMTVDTVVNTGCAGAIAASHVTTFPTPPYSVPVPPLPTTGGTGTNATYDPLYLNTNNYTDISTGSSDSITYSNVLVEQGCVFLNYEVWPLPGNPGGQTGSTFSVFADGSGTAIVDALTGLITISSNVSSTEPQPEPVNNRLGGYNGWKVAKLCGLSNGTHSFAINKVSAGYEGIQYLASPRATLDQGSDSPNLNVEGILPIYPNATNGWTAAIATYNQNYSDMVDDLAHNFGRRIVYTDMSSVDMNQPYYVAIGNQFWGSVQTCGISGGVMTLTEVYSPSVNANLPTQGQVLEASNLQNCGVANGVLMVIQTITGSLSSATLTLTPEFPYTTSGAAVAASTITVAAESSTAVTELTMNGWIVNASSSGTGPGQLHMPQNAQMDAARRIENADRTIPGLPGNGGQWTTLGQKRTGRFVSIFTDLNSPGTINAFGSTINSSSVLSLVAPNTVSSTGGTQFGQYTPVPNVNPGPSKPNYNYYAEFSNFRLNMLSTGLGIPTRNFSSSTVNFVGSAYSDGVFILSQNPGTGATGTGSCALAGGTFTHAGTCQATLNGTGGVNVTITNPGDYTVLPTACNVTGFGSLTGNSCTFGFNNYLVILSQNSGSGYTSPSCSVSGGTFLVAATCTVAINIASGAVVTITPANGGSYSSLVGVTIAVSDPTGSGFSAVLSTNSLLDRYSINSLFIGNAPVQYYLQIAQTSQPVTSGIHGVRLNAINNSGFTFNFTGCTACMVTLDPSAITGPINLGIPNQNGTLVNSLTTTGSSGAATLTGGVLNIPTPVSGSLSGNLTTTAATSDAVTVTGATSSSHCSFGATNALAATNIATTWVSGKVANSITVTHVATSGMTYDLTCTPN